LTPGASRRQIAGLFSGKRRIAGSTEDEIYKKLGLAYIPPEMREDRGEVALAKSDDLPRLVTRADIRGDLHVHSDWTDGTASIAAWPKQRRHKVTNTLPLRTTANASPWRMGLTPRD